MNTLYKTHRDIAHNILILCLEKIATIILIFYSEGLISRALGIESYGQWLYSLNFIIAISSIVLIAGAEVAIPALSRHPRLRWHIVTSVFIIRLFIASAAFLIANIYFQLFIADIQTRNILSAISITILINEPFAIVINYYQSRTKIGMVAIARILSLLARSAIVLIAFQTSSETVIHFSRAAESILLAFLLVILINKSGFRIKASPRILKIMLSRGAKLWLPLMAMLLYMRIDRFYIEHYLGFSQLAQYGVSLQIMEQATLILGIAIQSISPKLIFARKNPPLKNILIAVIAITLTVQVFLAVVIPPFVTMVFGENYSTSIETAKAMLPALIFYAIDTTIMQTVYREKNYSIVLYKWIFMLAFSSGAYYIWFDILKNTSIATIYMVNCGIMMSTTIFLKTTLTNNAKK